AGQIEGRGSEEGRAEAGRSERRAETAAAGTGEAAGEERAGRAGGEAGRSQRGRAAFGRPAGRREESSSVAIRQGQAQGGAAQRCGEGLVARSSAPCSFRSPRAPRP